MPARLADGESVRRRFVTFDAMARQPSLYAQVSRRARRTRRNNPAAAPIRRSRHAAEVARRQDRVTLCVADGESRAGQRRLPCPPSMFSLSSFRSGCPIGTARKCTAVSRCKTARRISRSDSRCAFPASSEAKRFRTPPWSPGLSMRGCSNGAFRIATVCAAWNAGNSTACRPQRILRRFPGRFNERFNDAAIRQPVRIPRTARPPDGLALDQTRGDAAQPRLPRAPGAARRTANVAARTRMKRETK